MITHKLPNPDQTFGLSPVVYPTMIRTKTALLPAIFTEHEIQTAIKRGEKFCTPKLLATLKRYKYNYNKSSDKVVI